MTPDPTPDTPPGRTPGAAGPPPPPSHVTGRRRIPEATVVRLPVYQRILEELLRSGTTTVSSEVLASMARVNAAKVRKDLSLLGSFGTRGAGYDAAFLAEQIDRELGLDREWPVVIVGIGNLGRALAHSQGFTSRGFRVTALFDVDPEVIGEEIDGVPVRHIGDLGAFAAEHPVSIGIIATPAPAAQTVADRLVEADVRSVLNFAPRVLTVPPDVQLRYVDLSIELQVMSFYRSRMAARRPGHGHAGDPVHRAERHRPGVTRVGTGPRQGGPGTGGGRRRPACLIAHPVPRRMMVESTRAKGAVQRSVCHRCRPRTAPGPARPPRAGGRPMTTPSPRPWPCCGTARTSPRS